MSIYVIVLARWNNEGMANYKRCNTKIYNSLSFCFIQLNKLNRLDGHTLLGKLAQINQLNIVSNFVELLKRYSILDLITLLRIERDFSFSLARYR